MSKRFIILQVIFLCIIGALFVAYMRNRDPLGSTYVISPIQATSTLHTNDVAEQIAAFPLINPAVTADLGKYFIINFAPLKAQLVDLQNAEKKKTFIYFLYLNNSGWIGLNEKDLFTAASTIKVPLAMEVYKLAEQGKLSLNDQYKLDASDLDSNFGALYKAGAGATSTIQDLLGTMLQYSDNTAARALIHVTQLVGVKDPFKDVYAAMGWQTVDFSSKPSYIDINEKTLSNMFIALYNATYLNPTDSEAIMHYLDLSTFDQQIAGGVPKDVAVAHKIGIDSEDNVYSDCGVVYVPNRPYILCLGMKDGSQVEADSFMQTISKTVYNYVTSN